MKTIERKSLLYKSGLGFWCINHVQGCAHGCGYPCYAFMMARQYGRVRSAAEWCKPKLVSNSLQLLERELKCKRIVDSVQLCLTTDPFMVSYPEVADLSLQLIEAINRRGIRCTVLTKGLLPADLANKRRFRQDNTYGFSLVSLDEDFRRRWEPSTAPFSERIAAARVLHEKGLRTRVHIEPYPTPNIVEQDITAIYGGPQFSDHSCIEYAT